MHKKLPFILGSLLVIALLSAGLGCEPGSQVTSNKAITAFSIVSPAATATINETNKTIALVLPAGSATTGLVATFTTTGTSVKVGGVEQVSGTTANDFTSALTYVVTAIDGSTESYTVTTTVAKYSDIATVQGMAATDLAASGATTSPTTLSETFALFATDLTGDPVVADVIASAIPPDSAKGLARDTSLTSAISDFVTKVTTDLADFDNTKVLDESADFSGIDLGSYFALTKASAKVKASVTTTDGAALDEETNLDTATGLFQASFSIDSKDLPATSAIKDVKIRINAGGTGSFDTVLYKGDRMPNNFNLDYGFSASVAVSFVSASGSGGKIVLSLESQNIVALTEAYKTIDETTGYGYAVPNLSVTLKVYKDNGEVSYSETWDSIDKFQEAISNLFAS